LKKSETKREGTKERRKYRQAEVKEMHVSKLIILNSEMLREKYQCSRSVRMKVCVVFWRLL
jgi:hypothetical protein